MTKLTYRQKLIKKKYTRVSGFFGGWSAYLQIDHQGFAMRQARSKLVANWECDMLAIALDRMLEAEKEKNTCYAQFEGASIAKLEDVK